MSDLIDRQAAIKMCREPRMRNADCSDFEMEIMMLPSAQPERKKGKWTDDNACPFCGFQPWYERDIHTLSFCPNCGSDMRGKQG